MPYRLVHFLIKNKCYSQFVTNAVNYVKHWDINIIEYCTMLKMSTAISVAFTWTHTDEAYHYWQKLYYKYEQETERSKVS